MSLQGVSDIFFTLGLPTDFLFILAILQCKRQKLQICNVDKKAWKSKIPLNLARSLVGKE